jgi:hypothetical protein
MSHREFRGKTCVEAGAARYDLLGSCLSFFLLTSLLDILPFFRFVALPQFAKSVKAC